MPTYSLYKIAKPKKVWDEFFTSWNKLQEYLAENPDTAQAINNFTGIGDPYRMGMRKPDDSFRDILRNVKSKHRGSTIDV